VASFFLEKYLNANSCGKTMAAYQAAKTCAWPRKEIKHNANQRRNAEGRYNRKLDDPDALASWAMPQSERVMPRGSASVAARW